MGTGLLHETTFFSLRRLALIWTVACTPKHTLDCTEFTLVIYCHEWLAWSDSTTGLDVLIFAF